jgi:hypothetical protein
VIGCGYEAESRIVLRVPEDYDEIVAGGTARVETGMHERRADASPLKLGKNGHRRKARGRQPRICFVDRDRREENVANEAVVQHSDERDRIRKAAKRIHDSGFVRLPERALIDNANLIDVLGALSTNHHRFE